MYPPDRILPENPYGDFGPIFRRFLFGQVASTSPSSSVSPFRDRPQEANLAHQRASTHPAPPSTDRRRHHYLGNLETQYIMSLIRPLLHCTYLPTVSTSFSSSSAFMPQRHSLAVCYATYCPRSSRSQDRRSAPAPGRSPPHTIHFFQMIPCCVKYSYKLL